MWKSKRNKAGCLPQARRMARAIAASNIHDAGGRIAISLAAAM
jgi:hypothetical protein